jgi:hypothetical protein
LNLYNTYITGAFALEQGLIFSAMILSAMMQRLAFSYLLLALLLFYGQWNKSHLEH